MSLSPDRADYERDADYSPNAYERREASKALAKLESAIASFRDAARAVARAADEAGVLEVYDHRARAPLSSEEQIEHAAELADETAGEWLDADLLRDLREQAGEDA